MRKPIKDYVGLYQIDQFGNVYSLKRNIKRKPQKTKEGYLRLGLKKNGVQTIKFVHILLYETFIGTIPQGYQVHHKDFNPLNNSLSNLQLLTKFQHRLLHAESQLSKERASRSAKGKKKPPRSEQWRRKKSQSMKRKIANGECTLPSFKGHKHSQQTKHKMSQAHKK